MTRRDLMNGCGAVALTMLGACAAKAVGPHVTPEAFGAIGDGVSDDYEALSRMVASVNAAGGGTVVFAPGRRYHVDRYIAAGKPVADLAFTGCDGLVLQGNGAAITVKGDFVRDAPKTRGLIGLLFEDCRNVTIGNLELNGNVDRTSRFAKMAEPPSHGLAFQSCSDVTIDNVLSHHFAGDGLFIRESKRTDALGTRLASRRFTVRNSRFLFNARQGMTVGQLRGGLFENCDFSCTGFIDSKGRTGPYGAHSPTAGVDVEPDSSPTHGKRVDVLTGDLTFRGCRMVGNYGSTFLAAKALPGERFMENVTVDSCHFECDEGVTGGQDGFIFDVPGGSVSGCTLLMKDKTAYLGWYQASTADPRFSGNSVSGRNADGNHPIFAVRPTGGAPIVEHNQFTGEERAPKPAGGFASALVFVDNPRAAFRDNRVSVPARALPAGAGGAVAVYLRAAVAEGNQYSTDLNSGGMRFFQVAYVSPLSSAGDFGGSSGSSSGAIRPIVVAAKD